MMGGFDGPAKQGADNATIGAYVSGVLAAIGWWCWIDAVIYNGTVCPINTPEAPCEKKEVEFAYWLPGIVATFGIVLINCFNYKAYANVGDGGRALACNNVWLFISFLLMFGTIIASVWIMVDGWGNHKGNCVLNCPDPAGCCASNPKAPVTVW